MSEDPGSTTLEIEVIARDPRWREAEPQADGLARRAAAAVLRRQDAAAGLAGPVEANIVLADDALVRSLNRTYRQQDRATNVLSFPNGGPDPTDSGPHGNGTHLVGPNFSGPNLLGPNLLGPNLLGPNLLGDVVLARETVVNEAQDQGKSVAAHLSHLVVHGVLHLLGFDHERASDAERMEALEVSILSDLGIADPYAVAPAEVEAK